MITRNNITKEYPKLNQTVLPAVLKQNEFEFLAENLDLYGQDATIDEFIDTFISKLNEVAGKEIKSYPKKKRKKVLSTSTLTKTKNRTTKKAITSKRKKVLHTKRKKKPVKKTTTAPVKSKVTSRKKRATEKKSNKNTFSKAPAWLVAIRKFISIAGKEYRQKTIRESLAFIQRSFDAKKVKTPTPHIDLIKAIQLTLVTSVNDQIGKDKIKVVANSALVEKCRKVSRQYTIRKTKQLATKKSVAVKTLAGLKKNDENLESLSGLGVIKSTDLPGMHFKSLAFDGKFKDLIGMPTQPFHIMVYGLPGSGKSTLAIKFAKYLAENHNLKILFLAKEEGISGTTQEKFLRLNAVNSNIDIAERMPSDLINYDVLMIDSVNEMNFTPDDIRHIQTKYPKLSTLQLFKATKEGKFLGASDFAHLCQAEIKCFDGKAQAQKNRFGGNLEIEI